MAKAKLPFHSVLVVGAGTMGRGIAATTALAGYETRIFDADPAAVVRTRGEIERSWQRMQSKGKFTSIEVESAREHLRFPTALGEGTDGVDFVVEAVPENLDLKTIIFRELDAKTPPGTILASNTSSLPIGTMAAATEHPERVIGVHFFNPAPVMPLVEIIVAARTSDSSVALCRAFAASLGKTAIVVKDAPGFATSRLGLALGLEAMRMLEEGVASAEDIDRAMELGYGHPMGPLRTSDLVGLDVRLAIAETLERELDGDRFHPPEILRRLVAEGKTGKKVGEGFFRWDDSTTLAVRPQSEKPQKS
jgi:3-hydroxybutyryl-CoA dehydrogenase